MNNIEEFYNIISKIIIYEKINYTYLSKLIEFVNNKKLEELEEIRNEWKNKPDIYRNFNDLYVLLNNELILNKNNKDDLIKVINFLISIE